MSKKRITKEQQQARVCDNDRGRRKQARQDTGYRIQGQGQEGSKPISTLWRNQEWWCESLQRLVRRLPTTGTPTLPFDNLPLSSDSNPASSVILSARSTPVPASVDRMSERRFRCTSRHADIVEVIVKD